MRKYLRKIKYIICALAFLFYDKIVFAEGLLDPGLKGNITTQTQGLGEKAGFATSYELGGFIAKLITAFLSLLGVIFIILIILAGYNWMTAGGEEEKVRKAKDMIKRALIGLFIIIAAYAITVFVFKVLPAGEGGGDGTTIM